MKNYRNSFTQVYEILRNLEETEYAKIPVEVIDVIFQNRNIQYQYQLEENVARNKSYPI